MEQLGIDDKVEEMERLGGELKSEHAKEGKESRAW